MLGPSNHNFINSPFIVLAGGLGTRLKAVNPTLPKPMVNVHGMPFLYWLLKHYAAQGVKQFIISTGYNAESIELYPWGKHLPECNITFAREDTPLGTGGAVLQIFKNNPLLKSAWVLNGDTLLPMNMAATNAALPQNKFSALYIAQSAQLVHDAAPNIHADGDKVTALGPNGTLFDAGLVYIERDAITFDAIPPCSLHEVLGKSMHSGLVRLLVVDLPCYDIGTPERLLRFEKEYLVNVTDNVTSKDHS